MRQRIINSVAALVALVALSAGAAPALADDAIVVVAGDDQYVPAVSKAAAAAIERSALTLAKASAPIDDDALVSCVAVGGTCPDQVAGAGASWIVAIEVTATQDAAGFPQLILSGYLVDAAGEPQQSERRFCEHCTTDAGIAALVEEMVASMLAADARSRAPNTFLDLSTNPGGARLYVDGKPVGPASGRYQLAPGTHEIEIRKSGYRPVRQEVYILANDTQTLAIELVEDDDDDRIHPIWGWTSLGAGAALTLGSIGLWTLDGPRSERGNRLPERYDTATLGIVGTVAGIAAMATGVVILWRNVGDDELDEDDIGFGASVTPDGAAAGFFGRF